MLQLLLVACVSLVAKMEEIEVPILLDLQVESYTILQVYDIKSVLINR
jgi:hypothetical protein